MRFCLMFFFLYSVLLFNSCREEPLVVGEESLNALANSSKAKQSFAIILSKALSDNVYMREFLQTEALKMIDNDYDVFYPFVKNSLLGNSLTFRDNILLYTDEESLRYIENTLPLLTIFIPTLPGGFSAESWDAFTEVPSVAFEPDSLSGDVFVYSRGFKDIVIKSNQVPDFSVLVVKNNERIGLRNSLGGNRSSASQKTTTDYVFISERFDNRILQISANQNSRFKVSSRNKSSQGADLSRVAWGERLTSVDLDLAQVQSAGLTDALAAYDVFRSESDGFGWPRDYIYYGLTPSNTKGKFKTNYREFIHYISISESGFNLMSNSNSDPDDPILSRPQPTSRPGWTDGYFEIRFDILSNSKNGEGEVITDIISVKPVDLFDVTYKRVGPRILEIDKIIPRFAKVDIPLQSWDLENVTYGWKISVSEVDQQSTTTYTTSHSSKFATNFGIDVGFGIDKVKIGLKFGTSSETTSSKSHTYSVQNTSDQLGDVLVYFGDRIYLGPTSGGKYRFSASYNSNISLIIAPKRI